MLPRRHTSSCVQFMRTMPFHVYRHNLTCTVISETRSACHKQPPSFTFTLTGSVYNTIIPPPPLTSSKVLRKCWKLTKVHVCRSLLWATNALLSAQFKLCFGHLEDILGLTRFTQEHNVGPDVSNSSATMNRDIMKALHAAKHCYHFLIATHLSASLLEESSMYSMLRSHHT